MRIPVRSATWSILLSALAGGIGGVGYVIVRYLLGSESELPRMFAGAYLIGGLFTGLLPGAATGAIFIAFVGVLRRFGRSLPIVISGISAGLVGTISTCALLIALNEQLSVTWFVAVFSVLSASFLIGLGSLLFNTSGRSDGGVR